MKKKSLAIALLLSASMMMAACSDDSNDSPVPEPIPVVNYKMSCVQNICNVTIREGSTGGAVISLNADDAQNTPVQGASVTVTSTGTGYSLINGPQLVTNSSGRAAVSIKGESVGSGVITFVAPDFNNAYVTFNVVIEANPVVVPDPEPKPVNDVKYDINVSYGGQKDVSMVEVGLFAGRTCAQIAPANLEVKNVAAIPMPSDQYYLGIKRMSGGAVGFNYTVKENDPNIFAVLAKDTANQAYGCADGLSIARKSINVVLNDAKPNVDIVEPGQIDYSGTYDLTSSFDALSLLPNHCGTVSEDESCDPAGVWFTDMLFGDWLRLSLNLLDNPGKTLSDVLGKQLIPRLADSAQIQEFLNKIGMGAIAPTLSVVLPSLIETLHLDTILDDFILQLTKNITWWDTADSVVTIVNNLAQRFTLKGEFIIPSAVLDENGEIGNITHSYSSILYNNGKFQNCVLGSNYGMDAEGNLICKIDISEVSDQRAIKGKFRAKFTEGVNPSVTINSHALSLAYGELIYKTLMQFVPLITQTSDGVVKKSLGGILEYYTGYGLLAWWNKKKAEGDTRNPAYISSSEFVGCGAIEEVIRKAVVGTDNDPSGFVQILSILLIPNIHTVCDSGINALDRVIENTLGYTLSVSEEQMNDVVNFEAKNCRFYPNEGNTRVVSIGKVTPIDDMTWWNSRATDERCNWTINVRFSDSKRTKASGKFFAVGMK